MQEEYHLFSASHLIYSLREGPYKNTINSVSELIDNSIQAKATYVQLICIDKKISTQKGNKTKRINQIAVYDNGIGMDPITLRKALQFGESPRDTDSNGIGRFGMGLPNSSFSRSRSVTVWSWRDHKTYKIKLSLDEIALGDPTIPEPIEEEIPKKYIKHIIGKEIEESGTFVLWDDLDKVSEKRSKNLLENHEFIIGRKYRYPINSGDVNIHLNAFELSDNNIDWKTTFDFDVRANDPLYLMQNTSTPELPMPYASRTLFVQWGNPHEIDLNWKGEDYKIELKFSIVDTEVRRKLSEKTSAGTTAQGVHAKKNIGVSIVRAGRELEPCLEFSSTYEPIDRWWGVEVSFPPGLDEVFGVDFYKQNASQFKNIDLEDEAKSESMTYVEYENELKENHDPRVIIHDLAKIIRSNLSTIKKQLKKQTEGTRKNNSENGDKANEAGTKDTRIRIEHGHSGTSDSEEREDDGIRKEKLEKYLQDATENEEYSKGHAEFLINNKLKFDFLPQTLGGYSFFSCESVAGVLNINVNMDHPFYNHLWKVLELENNDESMVALKILMQSWARLEDEAPPSKKQEFGDLREDWGRIVRDQLQMTSDD
jgi:hypothetical protein